MNRRDFLLTSAAAGLASGASPVIGFGLGDYGLRALKTPDAIKLIAGIGYDAMEFTMMDGYPLESAKASASLRKEVRQMVRDRNLAVPSLLEQVHIIGDDATYKTSIERIKRDAQLGHDISPGGKPPVVQTHLGGKDADWDKLKNMIVERLHGWAEAGRATQTVVCIKGHNLNLMDTSERSAWVMKQVNSPWLRLLFDYSHYEATGEKLGDVMNRLLPYTAMISVKDARPKPGGVGFDRLLPGDGKVDYVDYYRRLIAANYKGNTVVEISGQIHSQPGYDPIATAKRCYSNVAPKMKLAGVQRPKRG
ncbi:MAG: sugar phosphate isomerase/epimerase family protein [Bryobacteraceae bacterium]